jgi:tripeptide aminopeptidase
MSDVVERFLRYVKIDTQSDLSSTSSPSTAKQFDLARLLADELRSIGLKDVSLDENCYVTATLPANSSKKAPVIGFIAHMDTSTEMSGAGVNPRLVEKYDGGDIALNPEKGIVLSPREFPELLRYKGQTLITTDGNTLLGSDDKSGVAEIMAAMQYLADHPEIQHGTIKIAFTPDEEVNRGTEHFDVAKFGVDFAYTVDGGEIGELQYENFNAARSKIRIQGRNVHPGEAKNKMINALLVAMELNALLPAAERPEHTEGYEGFYHLLELEGKPDQARMDYIIRDHDRAKFEARKAWLQRSAEFLNARYGPSTITIEIRDQYYNMREKIEPVWHVIELAEKAMRAVGVEPKVVPIRGGTDGAKLSYMGLPCPNLFTGGHNFHGRYEYVPVESMEKAVEVIVKIVEMAIGS